MTTFQLIVVFTLCVSVYSSQDLLMEQFHRSSVCNVTERIKLNCSLEIPGRHHILQCCAKCLRHETCNGASVDGNGTCFLHRDCLYWYRCEEPDETHHFLQRHCQHGTWNISTQVCDCPRFYSGHRCEIHPPHCFQEMENGLRVLLDPEQDGRNPFPVTCKPSSPAVIVLTNKGHMSMNMSWEEYKNGFYLDTDHQWLGLEPWRRLSLSGCKLVRYRVMFNSQTSIRLVYNDFILTQEEFNYRFTYNTSDNEIVKNMPEGYVFDDCLVDHQNTPFSTWDRDHDGSPGENCAARAGSGWWFSGTNCDRRCNLLGQSPGFLGAPPSPHHLYLQGTDIGSLWMKESYVDITLQRCKFI